MKKGKKSVKEPIFDPLGLFSKSSDPERNPDKYDDLYKRDMLLFIPLDHMKRPDCIYQYRNNGISIDIIKEMAQKHIHVGGYFSIYPSRYLGPSDWYFEHLGGGELRTVWNPFHEVLGHVVLMREIDINQLNKDWKMRFEMGEQKYYEKCG